MQHALTIKAFNLCSECKIFLCKTFEIIIGDVIMNLKIRLVAAMLVTWLLGYGKSVDLLPLFRLKYLQVYWMDWPKILYRYSWSKEERAFSTFDIAPSTGK